MTTYYPLTRRGEFEDLNELCRQTGIDLHTAERYVFDAGQSGTQLIVCNRIVLGDPTLGMRAVLQVFDTGKVTLWLGMMFQSSQELAQVMAYNLGAATEFGVDFAVGASNGESASLV
ncbi:MAG: hypothetical protein HY854_19880 [Burkholderiales bacterium]|nr:hypothetical protein [Burkholderiales bacterium]